ncbi:MAG: hypothetical protein DDT30_01027 [Dehalococcoidia bacterium]|nr:hypothetical protein [Bacillota bacterium]MBT9142541.1 hypothetical protein [Bacillota bacterium]
MRGRVRAPSCGASVTEQEWLVCLFSMGFVAEVRFRPFFGAIFFIVCYWKKGVKAFRAEKTTGNT